MDRGDDGAARYNVVQSPTKLERAGWSSSRALKKVSHAAIALQMSPRRVQLHRSLSGLRVDKEFRFNVFFQVYGREEEKPYCLQVHRSMSLVVLRAMLQREAGIPFEEQHLYYRGEFLEGDEELPYYEVHDQSLLQVRIHKTYRHIGDIFTTIQTVRFPSKNHPDDFQIVDVVASLPPLRVVFRRLLIAIGYISALDKMQARKTSRRVWRQRVQFWETLTNVSAHAPSKFNSPIVPRNGIRRRPARTSIIAPGDRPYSDTTKSFVRLGCNPERVDYLISLADKYSISQRLQVPLDVRTHADLRYIKKWLASLKYFAEANLPESVLSEIARTSTYTCFKSGEDIFRQGDVGDFFYIVISGCVSLSAFGNGWFATMTPGMCFGEISLFAAQGKRTATANVNFAAPMAELAVLSGDVYRRSINPYKQAVLQTTEANIYSIPQLRQLPDHVVTHVAYAAKTLTARVGKRLIRQGDDINVLVLLVKGEVKVSSKAKKKHHERRPSSQENQDDSNYSVVTVVPAPAVFGQEGCLSNTPTPAPWDVDAIDTCTLVCFRVDTISIFLAPRQDIIRTLLYEHYARVNEFRRRFASTFKELNRLRRVATAAESTTPRHLSFVRSRLFNDENADAKDTTERRRSVKRLAFPKILERDQDMMPSTPNSSRRQSSWSMESHQYDSGFSGSPRRPTNPARKEELFSSRYKSTTTPSNKIALVPSCAEVQDQFLHLSLPYSNILTLKEQMQFMSFEQQLQEERQSQVTPRLRPNTSDERSSRNEEDEDEEQAPRGKTKALLEGLRRLEAQQVELQPTLPASRPPQFVFSNVKQLVSQCE